MEYFWEKNGWKANDRHLSALEESPFRRPFLSLPEGSGLFVIRGPRQIGKSCWLKTLLSKAPPKEAFYLSCENVEDYKELAEIIRSAASRTILMFDEVTFVKEWWRAIKYKLDQDSKVRIILTGSHAFDIRQGMDQMPGRWGNGGDFQVLPMDFSEFVQMRQQAGWESRGHLSDLENYFRIGGFPTAVSEAGEECKTPFRAMDTYQRWLLGDFRKVGKQEQYLREILGQLAVTMSSSLSLQKIAQRTQIGSHNTAQDYLELLESCFALNVIYALDPNSGAPRFRKEKKFYFRDPILYWIALRWAQIEPPQNCMDQLAEQVANEHLLRRYQGQNRFGYYADKKGEIDFYSHNKWALEIKWKDIPLGLSSTFRNLQVPKKVIWSKSNYLMEWPGL